MTTWTTLFPIQQPQSLHNLCSLKAVDLTSFDSATTALLLVEQPEAPEHTTLLTHHPLLGAATR